MITWTAIVVAAASFLAVVWGGRYLQQNRRRYPLPDEPASKMPEKLEGTPVSQTPDGRRWLEIAAGTCPHCHDPNAVFVAGPQGGMSQNIQCLSCSWWFNVTPAIGIAADIGFKDDRGRNL